VVEAVDPPVVELMEVRADLQQYGMVVVAVVLLVLAQYSILYLVLVSDQTLGLLQAVQGIVVL
jgi:hypothetical protein